MATNKNAIIRYKILDKCFRNSGRKYFIEDLINECNKILSEIDPSNKGISRRQVFDDIAFMESNDGWSIELDRIKEGRRVYYRYNDLSYSINNIPLDESEVKYLSTMIQSLSKFKGFPQFDLIEDILSRLTYNSKEDRQSSIIEFENNEELIGLEYIGTIYNAIIYKKVLRILYNQSFESEIELIIHPYYLKQYNNRWFLFGYNPDNQRYDWNLALDRILKIEEINKRYNENTAIDWNEYFDDMLGVSKPLAHNKEKIILHIIGKTAHYIYSKPIHPYQKHRWIENNTLEIELNLIINYELERFILSYIDSIKIIQPLSLKETIQHRLKQFKIYNK